MNELYNLSLFGITIFVIFWFGKKWLARRIWLNEGSTGQKEAEK